MCTSETEATRPAAANVVLSHHHLLVFPPFLHATGHMVLAKSRNTLVPMARNYFSRNILLCACVTYVCARERALLSFLLVFARYIPMVMCLLKAVAISYGVYD